MADKLTLGYQEYSKKRITQGGTPIAETDWKGIWKDDPRYAEPIAKVTKKLREHKGVVRTVVSRNAALASTLEE